MPPTRRRGAETGQATIEHVGVMLLVAAVLGAAVLVADAAGAKAGIAGSVRGQMARAICLVEGGAPACVANQTACVIGSHNTGFHTSVDIIVFHDDEDRLLIKERRSDGKVAMT